MLLRAAVHPPSAIQPVAMMPHFRVCGVPEAMLMIESGLSVRSALGRNALSGGVARPYKSAEAARVVWSGTAGDAHQTTSWAAPKGADPQPSMAEQEALIGARVVFSSGYRAGSYYVH